MITQIVNVWKQHAIKHVLNKIERFQICLFKDKESLECRGKSYVGQTERNICNTLYKQNSSNKQQHINLSSDFKHLLNVWHMINTGNDWFC